MENIQRTSFNFAKKNLNLQLGDFENGRQPLRGVTEEGDEGTEASEAEGGGGKSVGGRAGGVALRGQKSLEVHSDLESATEQQSPSNGGSTEQQQVSLQRDGAACRC